MAILKLEFFSSILTSQQVVRAVLPDRITSDKLAVIWLFHGLGDDGSCWLRKTRLESLLDQQQVMAIIPDMGRSFYSNSVAGQPYWDYLNKELIPNLQKLFPISQLQEKNYLVGNSMGGFGAMKIAILRPQKFRAVFSLSPVVDLQSVKTIMPDLSSVFGKKIPYDYLKKLFLRSDIPKLKKIEWHHYIGQSDFMFNDNQKFVAFLKRKIGLSVDYQVDSGVHDWNFWDKQLEKVIKRIKLLEKVEVD